MLITKMSQAECFDLISHNSLGRMACANNNQPYIVPVTLVLDGDDLYGFAVPGQKIDWMRANPRVCVEVDCITSLDSWSTVVIYGRYEELPDTPELAATRAHAYRILQQRAMWWEPASKSVMGSTQRRPLSPVYFRVRIDKVTGRRATAARAESSSSSSPTRAQGGLTNWLGHAFRHRSARQR